MLKALTYYLTADTRHAVHSPFVFSLVDEVINNKIELPAYQPIEALWEKLKNDNTKITVEDFGANPGTYTKTISKLAKSSALQKKHGRLLHRLVKYFKPGTVIELGTSLGISGAYLSSAIKDLSPSPSPKGEGRLISIEGAPEVSAIAQKNFKELGLDVDSRTGNFDEVLPQVLAGIETVDFAFIDGNHKYEPTINYFNQLLAKSNNKTVMAFHDIHWSAEMEQAWQHIKNHPKVFATIDLHFIGLVFFNPDLTKQHYTIRY